MPKQTLAEKRFEKLTEFKDYMNDQYTATCKAKFGEDIFEDCILPYLDDFMGCIEMHLEDLAEQTIQEEDYDDNEDEETYEHE